MILMRVLMMPCGTLLSTHYRNTSIISLLGSFRGRVYGLYYSL